MLYSYFDPKKIYESRSISGSSIVSNNNLIGIYSRHKNLCIFTTTSDHVLDIRKRDQIRQTEEDGRQRQ